MLRWIVPVGVLLSLAIQAMGAVTPATYTGANGNWNVGANWSTNPTVPLNAGANTFGVTITSKNVAYNVAGSNAVDTLALSSATLTLASGNNLSVVNTLSSSHSTVTASGGAFSVGGVVTMDSTNLSASGGGSISLPGLTSYSTASSGSGTFTVDGATSSLNVSALTTLNMNQASFTAVAQNGATLSLAGLTTHTGSGSIFESVSLQSNGSGSVFRANAMTAFTMNGASITVQAQNGGLTEMTALASVSNSGSIFGSFNAFADGAGSKVNLNAVTTLALKGASDTLRATAGGELNLTGLTSITFNASETLNIQSTGTGSKVNLGSAFTSFNRVAVTVQNGTILWGTPTALTRSSLTLDTGGTINTSGITNIDGTSLTATNGATLALGAATFSTLSTTTTWKASNTGSLLQLASLTGVTLTGADLTLTAQNGGTVNLPASAAVTNTSQTLHVQSTGTGAVVNIPLIGTVLSRLDVTVGNGGSVQWGAPTSVTRSSIALDTSGTLNTAALTNIDSTNLTATNGATLTIGAGVTAFGAPTQPTTWRAAAANSLLKLPGLTTVTLTTNDLTAQAQTGGTVDLSTLATLNNTGQTFHVQATGAGSQVILTGLSGTRQGIDVSVGTGGTVSWGTPTAVSRSTIAIDTTGTVNLAALTNIDSTNLTATNGASLIVGLGVTAFNTPSQGATWRATGAGSLVRLAGLTSVTLTNNDLTLTAQTGGTVDLPSLGTINNTGQTFRVQSTGAGSLVNLSALGPVLSRMDVTVSTGGTVSWGSPTSLKASSVTVNTSGTVNVANLTNIDSTSFHATGGAAITVPLPTAMSTVAGTGANIQADAGSTVTLPAVTSVTNPGDIFSGVTFQANGAGGKVFANAVTQVTNDAASVTLQASSGGEVQMNALTTTNNLGSIFGSFNISVSGSGSKIALPAYTTMHLNGQSNAISASAGGLVDLPLLTAPTLTGNIFEQLVLTSNGAGSVINVPLLGATLNRVSATVQNGGTIQWGTPTVVKQSSITIDPVGTLAIAQITNLDSTSVNAANGANVSLPNVTAYSMLAGTGSTLQSSGAGSQLSLPGLVTMTNPGDVFSGISVQANGAGSKTLLQALKTVQSDQGSIEFKSSAGGTVDAGAVTKFQNVSGSIFGSINASADGSGSKTLLTALTTINLNGASNTYAATNGGDLEMPALTSVTGTGNIFENFVAQSTGAGSLVNLRGMFDTTSFPDQMSVSSQGKLNLGGLLTPFLMRFAAKFDAGISGTLDVYLNDVLLTHISPSNAGNFSNYQLSVLTSQPGGSVVSFVANGSGGAVTLQDYTVGMAAVPEPASLVVLGVGAGGMLLRRRRRVG